MGPAENLPPRVVLPLNAVYRFTTWDLDDYGSRLPGSNRIRRWTVVATTAEEQGYSAVTLVEDSSADGVVTRAFRFMPGGDIYQYGYLADLVQRLEGRTLEPTWDLIAAYSQGWYASWTVGYLDSAQTDAMWGSSSQEELFFTATINGVSTIVAGYPVVLSSRSIETVMWISEKPPAFVRIREERFPSLPARLGTLSEVSTMHVPGGGG